MNTNEILQGILRELMQIAKAIPEEETEALREKIRTANKIFVAGAGRSLMMIRGLAMRLMQLGYQAYVVGETVTPAMEEGDLLIIASGSGETGTLCSIAAKCKKLNGTLALITTKKDSTIGKMADLTLVIPAATTKRTDSSSASVQLGANSFEQLVLLLGDALTLKLTEESTLTETNARLMKYHANLE